MLFFWALFDGVVSYIIPISINQAGFSDTMLGVIIGSSSVAGALFDFLLSKFLKQTHFRRLYLFMFAVCFVFSFVLWQSHTLFLFLTAMALWGFYYDLENFGNFDFVGRKAEEGSHSAFFGIMLTTKDLGYTLAPIFTGLILGAVIDIKPFFLMWFFLGISFIFFIVLIVITKRKEKEFLPNISHKPLHALVELNLWNKIGKVIFPVLLLTVMLNVFDSFFWTLGPLIAESFTTLHPFNGIFLAMYTLPPLFTGWFVHRLTKRFGKKKTAFYCFIVGSGVLSLFALMQLPFIILGGIFLASLLVSFSPPSINGAYADYNF